MTRSEVLAACLELPLSTGERVLMRHIASHNQAGTLPQLGEVLRGQEPEIRRVFDKCRDLLLAQSAHV